MSLRLGTKIVAGNAIVAPENIYIKSTYDGGTSGYRIWSDGYCEQWGVINAGVTSVVLLKQFINEDYIVVLSGRKRNDTNAIGWNSISTVTQLVSSFTIASSSQGARAWRASGYLASGQY